ncbi:outer membrane protein OmpA-like peptidoglycan-associated protein [Bosea sp. OAE752]|jgi:outer membrane protein OmpA-like peptidoglycan-associated protein|uniref:OmpA family protein n=1 Tax=Bosea spartocytisi TaxID=2773451 RepID=A0A927ED60_9HYPH|nr:OmpA family protein [Bosea spartocytisi]MBD3848257.1 OmpA family protein [Bosea spartocytisi]MCT4471834.1 OmpA family protein [Bosea spartocytisi]
MRKQSAFKVFVALAGSMVLTMATGAMAQTYKADDIVKHFQPGVVAPKPAGVTRGLCIGTEAECAKAGHAVEVAKPPSAFDLVVKFKYNSDVLEPEAKGNLDEFAKALKTPQLSSQTFMVEGHTDAAGNPSYNMSLSERRAEAVVRYLGEKGVNTGKLVAKGYGQSQPVVADPFSGDNRRVETRLRAAN